MVLIRVLSEYLYFTPLCSKTWLISAAKPALPNPETCNVLSGQASSERFSPYTMKCFSDTVPGGGLMLRSALSLSLATGKAFRIENIRAKREGPGLLHYISESGRRDLCEILRTGGFKITVPEEGALLVVAWLIDRKMEERAHELLDLIVPFFDRLRFYPVPDVPAIVESNAVRRNTVGEIVESLRLRRPQVQVGRMLEAPRIWLPMYDRAVALFLETVEDRDPEKLNSPAGSRCSEFC